eukprot:5076645-Amphidinium_carterae.2
MVMGILPPNVVLRHQFDLFEDPSVVNTAIPLEPIKLDNELPSLRGITGLVGPMMDITVFWSTKEDMRVANLTGEPTHEDMVITKLCIQIRSSTSPSSPTICSVPAYTLLRVVGNTRLVNQIVMAKVEIMSDASPFCGSMGYTVLDASFKGGPVFCRPAGMDDLVFLREPVWTGSRHGSSGRWSLLLVLTQRRKHRWTFRP